jgi:hypothetical protein
VEFDEFEKVELVADFASKQWHCRESDLGLKLHQAAIRHTGQAAGTKGGAVLGTESA